MFAKIKTAWQMWRAFLVAFVLAVAVICAGCCNVMTHAKGKVSTVYMGSASCCELIFAYPGVAVPLVVDLPFELVADTVTLPYDIFTLPGDPK